jgi:hypothetical protein
VNHKYVVDTITNSQKPGPAEVRFSRNPTSDRDPNVTKEAIFDSILEHCRNSRKQWEELQIQ